MDDNSENIEQAISSAIKTIAENKYIDVIFRKSNQPSCHIDQEKETVTLAYGVQKKEVIRGMADLAALTFRFHDPDIHHQFLPSSPYQQQMFEVAEEARIEALGTDLMPGIAKNLDAALNQSQKDFARETETKEDSQFLVEMLRLLIRENLTGKKPPKAAAEWMTPMSPFVTTKIGPLLANLSTQSDDQEAFAKTTLAIIEQITSQDEARQEQQQAEVETTETQDLDDRAASEEMVTMTSTKHTARTSSQPGDSETTTTSDTSEDDGEEIDDTEHLGRPNQPPLHTEKIPYQAYTRQYDQVVQAHELCSDEELVRLRKQLDHKLSNIKDVTRRLANRLRRQLMAKQERYWERNLEEGIIDSSKLALLVADPMFGELFQQEIETEQMDTVVTLLIDNSGSMRGKPITVAALCADILARTLELCDIKTEILGFTTKEWKGGQSRKHWLNDGGPADPGRLNDLRHIVYKEARTPWRHSKTNLGLMLREGILKENIDGEAIMWACERLAMRQEKRRILLVISDGAPVDDSTHSANSPFYLEQHLKEVIHMVEKFSSIELLAIGIGHDVTRYYDHAVMIKDAEQLGDVVFQELTRLLG